MEMYAPYSAWKNNNNDYEQFLHNNNNHNTNHNTFIFIKILFIRCNHKFRLLM